MRIGCVREWAGLAMMYHTRTRAAGQILPHSPSLSRSTSHSAFHVPERRLQQNAGSVGFFSSCWNRNQEDSHTEEERDVIRGGSTEEYLIHETLKCVGECAFVPLYMSVSGCPSMWIHCRSSSTADTPTRGSAHPFLPSPHSSPPPYHLFSSSLLEYP